MSPGLVFHCPERAVLKSEQLDSEESTATNESLHEDPSDKTFTPIIALSRYPYKLIKDDSLSQQIASRFFDKNQFWARSWDMYAHSSPKKALSLSLISYACQLLPLYALQPGLSMHSTHPVRSDWCIAQGVCGSVHKVIFAGVVTMPVRWCRTASKCRERMESRSGNYVGK